MIEPDNAEALGDAFRVTFEVPLMSVWGLFEPSPHPGFCSGLHLGSWLRLGSRCGCDGVTMESPWGLSGWLSNRVCCLAHAETLFSIEVGKHLRARRPARPDPPGLQNAVFFDIRQARGALPTKPGPEGSPGGVARGSPEASPGGVPGGRPRGGPRGALGVSPGGSPGVHGGVPAPPAMTACGHAMREAFGGPLSGWGTRHLYWFVFLGRWRGGSWAFLDWGRVSDQQCQAWGQRCGVGPR